MSKPKMFSLSRFAKLSGKSLDNQLDTYILPAAIQAVKVVDGRVGTVIIDGFEIGIHVHPPVEEFEQEVNRALDSTFKEGVEFAKALIEERLEEKEKGAVVVIGDRVMDKKGDLN